MRHLKLQLAMVAVTVALFALALAINHWLFARLEFAAGINWIYLPAGVRLLATLLFAEAGAVGLLLVSWPVNFLWFFPDDPERAFVGGVIASAVPYLLYLAARRVDGLHASLANLTPGRLLLLAVANAVAGPLLQHLYLASRGQAHLLPGFVAMATGDLAGTLIVLYGCRAALHAIARPR
ncbi:hypothetical protein ACPWT1_21750 [Ramlibacter sp. MMS24-I3-19]|uniref:hypothetical protein n=1 Tax=Ramlibacter sp. MMS24-I3-19 TaxID=3416606 RepID=UPI003CFFFF5F